MSEIYSTDLSIGFAISFSSWSSISSLFSDCIIPLTYVLLFSSSALLSFSL